jgi:hypothetical protein
MRKALRGFADLIDDDTTKEFRRKDPPSRAQAAAERARERESKFDLASALEQLAARVRAYDPAPAPATAPPPPHVPLPPGAPPPPELKYDARVGWHIPSTLSLEQLARMDAWARSDRSR